MTTQPVVESLLSSEFFIAIMQRWTQLADTPQVNLLRLSLLRDVVRAVHAEKSKHLAHGAKTNAETLRNLELFARDLQHHDLSNVSLADLLRTSDLPGKVQREKLPKDFLEVLGADQFERYDRGWEKDLALEAININWQFWLIDAWVQITAAEEFHKRLTNELFPKGTVLFVEAAPQEDGKSAVGEAFDAGPIWKGRWYVVCEPRSDQNTFNIDHLAGISLRPQKPVCKLLFPV